ncbi:MAG: recombinase family protein [Oscillospiraceae bacterium]|nr:recombinase family protein [Oscillospiraceae bacterium]
MAEITIIPAKKRSDEVVRTAAYARVSSSSEDQLNSFAAQIRYYTELLKDSTNAVFVDMYADEGISGTSAAKRTEFQRMMSDCRKGKIDRILAKSISRFARNTKDSLEAVRELKTLGISVYFEKENIDTGEISSEMMLAIYSQFAQEESMSISRNCRMGVHKRMMDGTYKTASTPFGYDYVNGELKINPEKAEIVKQIFSWYVSGIGMNEIATRLNQLGIRKEIWRRGTIHCILTNEKYIGDTRLQKSFMTDVLPFRNVKNRGEKEQYYVNGTHEPIIEKSIFDNAKKILAARDKSSVTITERSPFHSKIVCGNCGSTFRRKDRKTYVCWVCRKHDESADDCNIRQIRDDEFRIAFVRLCNKLQAHGKAILAPMLRQLETLSEREKSGNSQLAELRKEISEIKQQTYLLTMLNSQGTLDGAYFKKHTQELDRKLMTAQKQLHANLDDKDGKRLDELRKLIGIFERSEPITNFDEIKFGQIVEKITVLSETEIRFGLIGGIGFTERIER